MTRRVNYVILDMLINQFHNASGNKNTNSNQYPTTPIIVKKFLWWCLKIQIPHTNMIHGVILEIILYT